MSRRGASNLVIMAIIVTAALLIGAYILFTRTPSPPPKNLKSLTIQIHDGSGTTNITVGSHSYEIGTEVTVTATPSPGWRFEHWVYDGSAEGNVNTFEVNMDEDHTLKAIFTQIQYTLLIQQPDGSGSTTPTAGEYKHNQGVFIQVKATPSDGWLFSHWLLNDTNSGSQNPIKVTMNSNQNLRPVFTQDNWLSIFYQDYSQITGVPANVHSYRYDDPSTPTIETSSITLSKTEDNYLLLQRGSGTAFAGITYIYGLAPAIRCRYIIDLEVTSGKSVSIGVGGVSLSCPLGRSGITIESDTTSGQVHIQYTRPDNSLREYDQSYSNPNWGADYGANTFTPDTIGLTPSPDTIVKLYRVSQEVLCNSLVTAIGSNKHQAYGYDGPHPLNTKDGMNRITANGMGGTIFADVDYIKDSNYRTYLKTLLDSGTGWDLGVHFSEDWDAEDVTMAMKEAWMISEVETLTTLFDQPPLTWCALGHANTVEEALWAKANLGLIDRAWRMIPQNFGGSQDIINGNFGFWNSATEAGYATLPAYVHETDKDPTNSPTVSVDGGKFNKWLDNIIANGVRLTGYYSWYMIQSNQVDAKFSSSIDGVETTINADTNGYNAIILVKIQADSVTAVKRRDQLIDYSESPEGYIFFEVEDDATYTVTKKTS